MEPIATRKTTKELVYEQLKKGVLSGSIDREEIFTETKLAEILETSRTPIREAVAELTNEGLLVHLSRKGFKVREIKENELEQIFYLRSSIEKKGISILTDTISKKQIEKLKQIIVAQEKAIYENNRIRYIELDQRFHRSMLLFADQNLLAQIFNEIYNLSLLIGHAAINKEGRMEEVIREHKNIINGLESREANVTIDYLNTHLEKTGENVKEKFYKQNVREFK